MRNVCTARSDDRRVHLVPSVAFQLTGVVRANHVDLFAVVSDELAEPRLVRHAERVVLVHQPLIRLQTRRAARMRWMHFVLIEVRVAREQEPLVALPHREPGVTERVTDKRHHRDLGR